MTEHTSAHPEGPPSVLLNRYELGRLLSRGGMAEVYQGRDLLLDRRVAIKLVTGKGDPELTRRLQQEAKTAALLTHPNVVAVHDIGLLSETVFVVMEYLEGETLHELLMRTGALPAERAVRIAMDVCSALEAAHEQNLIHRDITPANVMVSRGGLAKVMDFGIAHLAEAEGNTATSQVLGTPAYLSPEQALAQKLDGRTDLYSLGCCLYQMLTGQVPFTGSGPVATANRHVHEQPQPPRLVNPSVPEALEAVVQRALTKDPGGRYQTAAEMKAELARVDPARQSTQAIPPATGTRTLPVADASARDSQKKGTQADIAPTQDEQEDDPGLLQRRVGVTLIVLACAAIAAVLVYLLYGAFLAL